MNGKSDHIMEFGFLSSPVDFTTQVATMDISFKEVIEFTLVETSGFGGS